MARQKGRQGKRSAGPDGDLLRHLPDQDGPGPGKCPASTSGLLEEDTAASLSETRHGEQREQRDFRKPVPLSCACWMHLYGRKVTLSVSVELALAFAEIVLSVRGPR